jgi:hypothetical protein
VSSFKCWRCGAGLAALSLPLSRLDECPECTVHLHACRMCGFYDSQVARKCREDDAEEVKEKERANFCDYFQPSAAAFDVKLAAADTAARDQLGSLFGDGEGDDSSAGSESAEDLFK